jgi:predicted P-loop ATPase
MDNMPVLEGASGLSKTTFLEVLGYPWYKSCPSHVGFGDKDFLQAILGAWLLEIPDMTNFSRRDHSAVLATITTRVDSYRASYGRTTDDHPRTCVFAATSETDDYLASPTGKRRYWPIRCQKIEMDMLHSQKEQVFAEAVQSYRKGETWYKMPGQAALEQEARVAEPDGWTEAVLDYAERSTGKLLVSDISARRHRHAARPPERPRDEARRAHFEDSGLVSHDRWQEAVLENSPAIKKEAPQAPAIKKEAPQARLKRLQHGEII